MKRWTDATSEYNSRISALESSVNDSGFTYSASYSTWAKIYLPENIPCASGSKAMGKLVVNATTETYNGQSYITMFDNDTHFMIWRPESSGSIFKNENIVIRIDVTSNKYSIQLGYIGGHQGIITNISVANGSYLISMIRK